MSLFLGKIHYWLFNKILWFENLEEEIIKFAQENGLDVDSIRGEIESKYGKKLENKKIISIGPITSKTIEDFGLGVYKEAEVATIDSTIEAISNDNNVLNKGELKC